MSSIMKRPDEPIPWSATASGPMAHGFSKRGTLAAGASVELKAALTVGATQSKTAITRPL